MEIERKSVCWPGGVVVWQQPGQVGSQDLLQPHRPPEEGPGWSDNDKARMELGTGWIESVKFSKNLKNCGLWADGDQQ